jgi:hypothetical protein
VHHSGAAAAAPAGDASGEPHAPLHGGGHAGTVSSTVPPSPAGSSASSGGTPGEADWPDDLRGCRGMYPSVGACDEFLRLLYYSRDVSRAELRALQGKATGCMEEGEVITLDLVPLASLWRRAPDAKTLCALLLLDKLVAEGLIAP